MSVNNFTLLMSMFINSIDILKRCYPFEKCRIPIHITIIGRSLANRLETTDINK